MALGAAEHQGGTIARKSTKVIAHIKSQFEGIGSGLHIDCLDYLSLCHFERLFSLMLGL